MAIDWTKIYEKYKGLWVALLDDKVTVIGSGKTVKETLDEAKKQGHSEPILMRVPTEIIPYVGVVFIYKDDEV